MRGIFSSLTAACAIFALAACAPMSAPDPRLSGPSATDLTRMASVAVPPRIAVAEGGAARGARRAAAFARGGFRDARGLRFLEVSSIPYLRQSPEGAAFLSQQSPRALVRGAPAASCPAAAASAPGAPTTEAAMEGAMSACFAQLEARGAPNDCRCLALAADNAILAPQDFFVFATGVSAFLIRDGAPALRIVAETTPAPGGGEALLLRDAGGVVGAAILEGDFAELELIDAPGRIYSGAREPFGYRRGRLAERLRLSAPDGAAATLLIGIESRDAAPAR